MDEALSIDTRPQTGLSPAILSLVFKMLLKKCALHHCFKIL